MALSFFYLEFLRMLQFLRLRRDDRADVAIEVVMSRHEVSVFRRQVERPSLLTGPREPLWNSGRFSASAVPVIENSSKRFEHSPPLGARVRTGKRTCPKAR